MTDIERLEAIEIKLAHLERSLQELDQTILLQQREIATLTSQNRALRDRIESLAGGETGGSAEFEKPPHY
jgi:SlyX protein